MPNAPASSHEADRLKSEELVLEFFIRNNSGLVMQHSAKVRWSMSECMQESGIHMQYFDFCTQPGRSNACAKICKIGKMILKEALFSEEWAIIVVVIVVADGFYCRVSPKIPGEPNNVSITLFDNVRHCNYDICQYFSQVAFFSRKKAALSATVLTFSGLAHLLQFNNRSQGCRSVGQCRTHCP